MLGLTPLALAYALTAVALAAVIRGYTGFGFSALVVTSLSLIVSPAEVVPIVYLLEVAASVHMLPLVWRKVDWSTLGWVTLGAAIATPVGIAILSSTPVTPLRLMVGVLVLGATLAVASGWKMRGQIGPAAKVGTGLISGTANGIAAVGGLPVVIFLLSSGASTAATRATLVAFFVIIDLYGAGLAASQGLFPTEVLLRTALFALPLVLGVAIGHRLFTRSPPRSFRRMVLVLLVILSCAVLLRAVLG